jgi:hypothetical protein
LWQETAGEMKSKPRHGLLPFGFIPLTTLDKGDLSMKKFLLISVLLLMTVSSHARVVKLWSYDEMTKKADVILIISVSEPSNREISLNKPVYDYEDKVRTKFTLVDTVKAASDSDSKEKVQTKFKVLAVLKGKYEKTSFELHHLAYRKDNERIIINGCHFLWFDKRDEVFWLFWTTTWHRYLTSAISNYLSADWSLVCGWDFILP